LDKDIISRILEKGESFDNELASFLDDGVSSILVERRDPYFTIAKNKVKLLISVTDWTGEARSQYTEEMITRLNKLYFSLNDEFGKIFTEICIESVKEGEYLNKEALSLLNEIYKSTR
jgi:hypothetical protein